MSTFLITYPIGISGLMHATACCLWFCLQGFSQRGSHPPPPPSGHQSSEGLAPRLILFYCHTHLNVSYLICTLGICLSRYSSFLSPCDIWCTSLLPHVLIHCIIGFSLAGQPLHWTDREVYRDGGMKAFVADSQDTGISNPVSMCEWLWRSDNSILLLESFTVTHSSIWLGLLCSSKPWYLEMVDDTMSAAIYL